MSLTVEDLNGVRAQWEEWVPDGYRLDLSIKDAMPEGVMVGEDALTLGARLRSEPYVQVEIWTMHPAADGVTYTSGKRVYSQHCPHDAAALRASVSVLARTIANSSSEGAADDGSG